MFNDINSDMGKEHNKGRKYRPTERWFAETKLKVEALGCRLRERRLRDDGLQTKTCIGRRESYPSQVEASGSVDPARYNFSSQDRCLASLCRDV